MSVNPENLLLQAQQAIGQWIRVRDRTCYLTVIKGLVVALDPTNYEGEIYRDGLVQVKSQHEGLTPAGWNRLRNHLVQEFWRDKECQQPHKPSP